jgi:hypothetical protein
MITFTIRKIIISPTLKNDNIQVFKNYSIYTIKIYNILYTWNDNIQVFKTDNIYTRLDVMIFECRGCYDFFSVNVSFVKAWMLSFLSVEDNIILSVKDVHFSWCTLHVIIFEALGVIFFFIKVSKCYHFRVL